MIEFEKIEPKKYLIKYNGEVFIDITLVSSTITNKYSIVTDFIEKVSGILGDEFDLWFKTFLTEYKENEQHRHEIVLNNIDKIKYHIDKFVTIINFDYSQFYNESRVKKTSILFLPDEIKTILNVSNYLKVFSVISNTELKLGMIAHKDIYSKFILDNISSEIINKIYDVVKTKTFKYHLTDKYMWDYIKAVKCKGVESHIIEIFNFIMNNILILCEFDKNPITYFVTVIDESIKWFLRSIYKDTIVYNDVICTEDIQSININNLKAYCYNDTISKLRMIAYKRISSEIECNDCFLFKEKTEKKDEFVDLQNKAESIKYVAPVCTFVTYPILSKVLDIPYKYFSTLSPETSIILSTYLGLILKKVFTTRFYSLFSLLEYYPNNKPSILTTYKLRDSIYFLNKQNEVKNFLGFKTTTYHHPLFCNLAGKIIRTKLTSIITGNSLMSVPPKLEQDIVDFYTYLFSAELDVDINEVKKMVLQDF